MKFFSFTSYRDTYISSVLFDFGCNIRTLVALNRYQIIALDLKAWNLLPKGRKPTPTFKVHLNVRQPSSFLAVSTGLSNLIFIIASPVVSSPPAVSNPPAVTNPPVVKPAAPNVAQSLAQAERNSRNTRMLKQARQIGVETALKNRKPNTAKAYGKAQQLWKQFCAEFDFEDKEFVSTEKLLLFTQRVVLKLTVQPWRRRKAKGKRKAAEAEAEGSASSSGDGIDEDREGQRGRSFEVAADIINGGLDGQPGAPLKYNTAKTYISGIMDLYNQQIARGDHNYPTPRGFGVRGHLEDLRATALKRVQTLDETKEYRTFAAEVLAACRNPVGAHSEHLHQAFPEVVRGLDALRREFVNLSHAMQQGFERIHRQQEHLEEVLARMQYGPQQPPPGSTTATTPAAPATPAVTAPTTINTSATAPTTTATSTTAPAPAPAPAATSTPQYIMDRTTSKVPDIWKEWHEGRGGKPSVLSLNDQYGSDWRKGDKNAYSRRKKLIDEIDHVAATENRDPLEVVQSFEEERVAKSKSLTWMWETWVPQQRAARES